MVVRRARRTGPNRGGRRKDPAPRHVDGSANWSKIKNPDPNKKYCWVYAGNEDMGPDYYAGLGYSVEKRTKGNASAAQGVTGKPGEAQVMRGHILMSIPLDQWQEIEDYGEDNKTGQCVADEREERMIDEKNYWAEDTFRGLGNRTGIAVGDNGTTALTDE